MDNVAKEKKNLHVGVIWFLEIKCERVGLTSNKAFIHFISRSAKNAFAE